MQRTLVMGAHEYMHTGRHERSNTHTHMHAEKDVSGCKNRFYKVLYVYKR